MISFSVPLDLQKFLRLRIISSIKDVEVDVTLVGLDMTCLKSFEIIIFFESVSTDRSPMIYSSLSAFVSSSSSWTSNVFFVFGGP